MSIPILEMITRYEKIYTGAISDILDERGETHFCLPHTLQPLVPGQRITGIAMPILGKQSVNKDPDEVYVPLLNMLGDIQPGQVIITQANDMASAHLGELSAETAKYRGCRGAVIYGGIRDTDYMIDIDFPAYDLYKTPLDVLGRWEIVAYNCDIVIEGIYVRPGDFIVGDRDGVLIIRQEIAAEILIEAEEVVATENLVRKAILDGVHPVKAYETYGRF
ncbi:MAG: RraA family protein [Chloroflexi bacterium]|nr:RraA family protein [Chloroflexota bacterium]